MPRENYHRSIQGSGWRVKNLVWQDLHVAKETNVWVVCDIKKEKCKLNLEVWVICDINLNVSILAKKNFKVLLIFSINIWSKIISKVYLGCVWFVKTRGINKFNPEV